MSLRGDVQGYDKRALDLMNAAAVSVMKELPDLILAYGDSDEYRCVHFHLDGSCAVHGRPLCINCYGSATEATQASPGLGMRMRC